MSTPKGESPSHSQSKDSGVVGEVAEATTTGLLKGVGDEVVGPFGGFFESFFTGKGGGGGGKKGGHGHH